MSTPSLHETDFYAWPNEQAALLRASLLHEADIAHIAEETESMGKTEKRELISRLNILLPHLLKWQFQPSHCGTSWRVSVNNARDDIVDLLADNPSLQPQSDAALVSAYRRATRQAAAETALGETAFPATCPWTFTQMTDPEFWPGG